MENNTVDHVVEAVRKDLLDRSQIGVKKYGVTLDRNDLSLKEWLQHAYEECLDQANYLKKCILEYDTMLRKFAEETKSYKNYYNKEKEDKEAQGWEDFREGAYNAWKKKEEEKERQEKLLAQMVEQNQRDGLYTPNGPMNY